MLWREASKLLPIQRYLLLYDCEIIPSLRKGIGQTNQGILPIAVFVQYTLLGIPRPKTLRIL
jgi:hypothetical protein